MERTERKEREYNQRRADILLAAERIFAAKGFYRTSVAEIAEASGFAVGTIYQFFPSKEQLYIAMVSEKLEVFYQVMREAAEKEEDALEKLRALVDARFHFVEYNMDFCTIFMRRENIALSEGNVTLREIMIRDYLDFISFIEGFLAEGVQRGKIRKQNPRLMAFALVGMMNSFTFFSLHRGGDVVWSDMASLLLGIFLEGVKTHEA